MVAIVPMIDPSLAPGSGDAAGLAVAVGLAAVLADVVAAGSLWEAEGDGLCVVVATAPPQAENTAAASRSAEKNFELLAGMFPPGLSDHLGRFVRHHSTIL
jgi:hypothetical protein